MKNNAQANSKRWLALTALCIAVFMSLLDSTIVNVALPTIQMELNESYAELQWVINAYTLAFAMCLLLAAKFGDLFGRKKIFLISLAIFTVGSVFSAISQSPLQLNFSRMFQGIGGAGMMSLSMTIVAETFDDKERGIAFGIWSSVVGVATALGPVIGGYLIKIFSWRSIFFINIPIGVIAMIMTYLFVEETFGNQGEKIDWLGMLLSTAMIFCLVFGLVQKENNPKWSWLDPHIFSYFVLSLILLILFIVLEKHLAEPMIDLAIFKSGAFVGTALASFCLGAGLYAYFTYMTIWMQNYLSYTAEQTGVRQLAIGLMSLLIGPIAGIMSNRFAKRWLIGAGLLLIGCGLLEIHSVLSLQVTYKDFVAGFIIIGIGNAIVNPPLSAAAMESVEQKFVGIASGVVNVFRQLGSTFGIVILGLILSSGYRRGITEQVYSLSVNHSAKIGIINALQNAGPVGSDTAIKVANSYFQKIGDQGQLLSQLKTGVFKAFDQGYSLVIYTAIGVVVFGAAIAMLLIKNKNEVK